MKIRITEKQDKLIKEEFSTQYQSDENEIRHFLTRLVTGTHVQGENIFIDVEHPLLDNDYFVDDEKTYIDVEWSIGFKYNTNGFAFKSVIKSCKGKVFISNFQDVKTFDIVNYKIDSSKLDYHLEDSNSFSYHLTEVVIDIQNKIIRF